MNKSTSCSPTIVGFARAIAILGLLLSLGLSSTAVAQEEKADPATNSNIIDETLRKIREVDNLDRYIELNKTLQKENGELKGQIASLQQQVTKLTEELKVENDRLRKQLTELPTFEVKSKMVSATRSMAVLQFGDRSIRIREGTQTDVPVSNGVWTLMNVKKISNELIEIEFPKLERTVILYD